MSWQPAEDPECPASPNGVELVLLPRAHDLGGFEVRRALPAKERQMVGPFILFFFDQMGRGEFLAGRGLDVRPHPHIGLSTVTTCSTGSVGTRARLPGRHAPGRNLVSRGFQNAQGGDSATELTQSRPIGGDVLAVKGPNAQKTPKLVEGTTKSPS
jgi:hypothetical protein